MSLSVSDFAFKRKHTFTERKLHSNSLRRLYPEKTPVVIQELPPPTTTLSKTKFLVTNDAPFGDFVAHIHNKLELPDRHTLKITTVDGLVPRCIGEAQRDSDGFVYLT